MKLDFSKVLKDSMLQIKPNLFHEWDFDKNSLVNIYSITKGSGKEYFWKCLKCKSSYKAKVYNRVRGTGCSYCGGKLVNETNSLFHNHPEIMKYWNHDINSKNNIYPQKINRTTKLKVWWNCLKCNSQYEMSVQNKTLNNAGCPYCKGKRVNHANCLEYTHPHIANEWHPTKNKLVTPRDVIAGSHKVYWWLGKCGHEWEAKLEDRKLGLGCPYCSSSRLLIGYNDMWTTNPDLLNY